MAARELTDDEVFGTSTPAAPVRVQRPTARREMSDDEVFGGAATSRAAPTPRTPPNPTQRANLSRMLEAGGLDAVPTTDSHALVQAHLNRNGVATQPAPAMYDAVDAQGRRTSIPMARSGRGQAHAVQMARLRDGLDAIRSNLPAQAGGRADYADALRGDVGPVGGAVRGFIGEGAHLNAQAEKLLYMPAGALIDAVHGALSGQPQTGASDYFGREVESAEDYARSLALDPSRERYGFGTRVSHDVAASLPALGAMLGTGGQSAALEAPATLESTAALLQRALGGALEHSAKASIVPATSSGMDTADAVLARGGSGLDAANSGATAAAATVLANMLPLSAEGGLAKRALTGAAVGPALARAQQGMVDATLPADMRSTATPEDDASSAISTALMSAFMGGRGPARGEHYAGTHTADAQRALDPSRPMDARLADVLGMALDGNMPHEAVFGPDPIAPRAPEAPAAPRAAAPESAPRPEAPLPRQTEPSAAVRPAPVIDTARLDAETQGGTAPTPAREAAPPTNVPEGATVHRVTGGKGFTFHVVDRVAPEGVQERSEFGQTRLAEAYDGDRKIGEVLYHNDGTPPDVKVDPEYRGRDVATGLYKVAEDAAGAIAHGTGDRGQRTPDGQAFRAKLDTSRVRVEPAARAELPREPQVIRTEGRPAPEPTPEPYTAPERPKREYRNGAPTIDLSWDHLGHWIAAEGGVDAESLRKTASGVDRFNVPENRPFENNASQPVVRKSGGLDVDALTERMVASGWLPEGAHNTDAAELVQRVLSGEEITHPVEGRTERDAREMDRRDAEDAALHPDESRAPASDHDQHDRLQARDAQDRPAPEHDAETGRQPARDEPAPDTAKTTGTKHESVENQRAERGDATERERTTRTFQSADDAAKATLRRDPEAASKLIGRIMDEDHSPTDVENAVLLNHMTRLRNERDRALEKLGDSRVIGHMREVARRDFEQAELDLRLAEAAADRGGSMAGRALNARKMMMAQDYTLAALERRAAAVKEAPLTPAEHAIIRRQAADIERLQRELDAAETRAQEASLQAEAQRVIAEGLKAAGLSPRRRLTATREPRLERLRKAADEARARLRENQGVRDVRKQGGAVDVGLLADYATIGAYHIANGAAKFTDFVRAMVAEIPGFAKLADGDQRRVHRDAQKLHDDDLKAATEAMLGEKLPDSPRQALGKIEAGAIDHRGVYNLVMAHVREAIANKQVDPAKIDEAAVATLMQRATDDLKTLDPDIDERTVRQLFSDYGRATFPSPEADRKALRQARRIVQLQESIERLRNGEAPLRSGPQRDKPTQQVRLLQKQLNDLLRAAEREHGKSPEALASYREARITNLKNQIDDLQRYIDTGERPAKRGTKKATDAEIEALTAERDRLRAEMEAIDKPQRTPEQKYNDTREKALKTQLEKLQARIAAGDYAPTTKRVPPALERRVLDAQFRLNEAKRAFHEQQFALEMAKRSPLSKVWGGAVQSTLFARAVMTSFDFSALGRQANFILMAHPARSLKSVPAALHAAVSPKAAYKVERDIHQRANAGLYKRAGLELTDAHHYKPTDAEEAFMSRWIRYTEAPAGAGRLRRAATAARNVATAPIRGSERAFVATLNRIRADAFDTMVAALAKNGEAPTDAELKAVANFVNVATGRGKVGVGDKAITGLNMVFFAPKLVASRFQLIAGQPFSGGSARTKKLVAQEYARYLIGTGVAVALLQAALGDEDIEPDPRSAKGGKIKAGPHTYLDPYGGLAQVTTFLSRVITGKTVTGKGDLRDIRRSVFHNEAVWVHDRLAAMGLDTPLPATPDDKKTEFGTDNTYDVAARFLRTKLAPQWSATWNVLAGENLIGEPSTVHGELAGMAAPLSMRDIHDVMVDNDVPEGLALSLLATLGFSVQVWAPNKADTEAASSPRADPRN